MFVGDFEKEFLKRAKGKVIKDAKVSKYGDLVLYFTDGTKVSITQDVTDEWYISDEWKLKEED